MAHPIPHPIPRGFRNRGEGRGERGEDSHPTVDPLPHLPSLPKTRKPYETPTPADRLRELENATVADAELIHDCRWQATAALRRIVNREAELDRLRAVVLAEMEAA